MKLGTVLELLEQVHSNGDQQWKAVCPSHDDSNPSLSIGIGAKKKVLLSCHAGCTYSEVMESLIDRVQERACEYRYLDEDGEWVGSAIRQYDATGNKRFFQRTPEGTKSSPRLKATPYMLPELLAGVEDGNPVLIVEGEKDAEALAQLGRVATTNIGGVAMGWGDEHSKWLSGASKVFIIADNDEPGLKHAWRTFDSVRRTCPEIKVGVFATEFGKDVGEHLSLGGKVNQLVRLRRDEDAGDLEANDLEGWRLKDASVFVFHTPTEVPAVWGKDGEKVLWAEGQGLVIAAPQGIGKTTLATLLLEARLGLSGCVLDMPMRVSERNTLYLAMDRPQQIALAMRRVFEKHGEEQLAGRRAMIHEGPPPRDLGKHPEALLELCAATDSDTVFVDSLKDAVLGLTGEDGAQGWNRAVQLCLAEGVQVCILHHLTKSAGKDEKPVEMGDIHGSNWLTAGMGSVLLLWGKPESRYLELTQLKSPVKSLAPLRLRRVTKTGLFEVSGDEADVQWFFAEPHTVAELAAYMFPGENSRTNMDKARRKVDELTASGRIEKHSEEKPSGPAGGRPAVRYILKDHSA
jgi:hypothetical protein